MKLKGYLFATVAAISLMACSEAPTAKSVADEPEKSGALMTVSFEMPSADIHSAYFYFFDKKFRPCAGVKSLTESQLAAAGMTPENPLVVLENPKEKPAYVIVVINPTAPGSEPSTIEEMRRWVNNHYAQCRTTFRTSCTFSATDEGSIIYGTPLSDKNIGTTGYIKIDKAGYQKLTQNLGLQ
jgi:hypothetical protein